MKENPVNQEKLRIKALQVGRQVLAALLQVVDADLALARAHAGMAQTAPAASVEPAASPAPPAPKVVRPPTGDRSGRPRDPNATSVCACPACGNRSYRNRLLGYSEDKKRIQKFMCDDCGHVAAARAKKTNTAKARPAGAPRRESKRARLARVVAIGEAAKRKAAMAAEVAA
jgi:hypothetical protein